MKLKILFVAAAVAIGSLSACGGSNTVTPGLSTPPAAAGPEPTQTTATQTPRAKTVGAFGDTITYPSAIAVKVSPGRVVPSSQTGMGAIEGKIVVFDLAVTNGGTEAVEGSMMGRPKVSYSAQGIEAQSAYDFALGNSGGSLSTILPGETQTVTVAYGIPTASFGDVRMEVHSANYSDPPAIFKGAVH
ncbi:hypothetical protein [Pseudarthrobacter sp. BRE9]|uniref:hypothetical protein n=1 Tax=Pseudarthrobacter sp. BRE9 TaxID=2962582 RepID=UPI0028822ADD|nr:hypothetical protein [Pseudarthrobacter sp. BRE9]MDT0169448.1 hypothetical protein [Pseudarthrobacter sp. BRE9]